MTVRIPLWAAAIGSLVWTNTSRGDTPKPSIRKRKAVIGLPSGRTAMYMLLVVSPELRYTVSLYPQALHRIGQGCFNTLIANR